MHITFRQLEVFRAVARNLSYTRAAKELYLSQPAVSMQVKQLEENLDSVLFEQLGKRIYLTDAGREVYSSSSKISGHIKELKINLDQLRGLNRGHLKISVATTANYFIPRIIAKFTQLYPDIAISLEITNRENQIHQLRNNMIDLAIMGEPRGEMELIGYPFMENPLVIVAPINHRLVGHEVVTPSELGSETFLVREFGSDTRKVMERFFQEKNVPLNAGMEVGNDEAIKQSVQAGLGLGFLSEVTLDMELKLRRLAKLNVEGLPIMRHWHLVLLKRQHISHATSAFKQFLLEKKI